MESKPTNVQDAAQLLNEMALQDAQFHDIIDGKCVRDTLI
jgi:hypothetical protein